MLQCLTLQQSPSAGWLQDWQGPLAGQGLQEWQLLDLSGLEFAHHGLTVASGPDAFYRAKRRTAD